MGLNLLVCPLREQRCSALSRPRSITDCSQTNTGPKARTEHEEGSPIPVKLAGGLQAFGGPCSAAPTLPSAGGEAGKKSRRPAVL